MAASFAREMIPALVVAVASHVPGRIRFYWLSDGSQIGNEAFPRRAEYTAFTDLALARAMEMDGVAKVAAPELLALFVELGAPHTFIASARSAISKAVQDIAAAHTLTHTGGNEPPFSFLDVEEIPYLSAAHVWAQHVPSMLATTRRLVGSASTRLSDEPARLPVAYPFPTYLEGTVNFGLQLVYRQSWTPLGTQAGEIIRTLPLGPRQSEKITIEAVQRTKRSMTSETQTSTQSTTEASTATKDSSEVTDEASSNFKWHAELSGGFNVGFASANLSAGMGGESAEASRSVKSNLGEAMEKTTAQLKQDTKVVISTESELSRQTSTVSEISNPNDEVAVTYVYSRLQRQYELHTFLSGVNTCVMYAESVPAPSELTKAWIRRHDWILSKCLLDESFRGDLETVLASDPPPSGGKDSKIDDLMDTIATNGLPAPAGVTGTVPDFYATPQAAYEREVERERARVRATEQYRRALERLQQHLYANVLHYLRNIWAQEDADARMLRYSAVRVPIRWTFSTGGSGPMLDGTWAPDVRDEARDTLPLSDIVDAGGPVGYVGNYAVLQLAAGRMYPGLDNALTDMRLPYLRHVGTARLKDGQAMVGGVAVTVGIGADRRGPGSYRLSWQETEKHWQVDGDGRSFPPSGDGSINLDSLTITVRQDGSAAQPKKGWAIEVSVDVLPILEDPELRQLRRTDPQPSPGTEAFAYSPEVLAEHAEFFPDVEEALAGKSDPRWEDLSVTEQRVIRSRWPQYLLRLRHMRRLLIDTNNVVLTRYVDPASSLEPFRSVLRYVDVLQAYDTAEERRLENQRRSARIDDGKLGDPSIEKVVHIRGSRADVIWSALEAGDETDTWNPS